MEFARIGQSNKYKLNFPDQNKIIRWKRDSNQRLLQPRPQSPSAQDRL